MANLKRVGDLFYDADSGFFYNEKMKKLGHSCRKKRKIYIKIYFKGKYFYAHRLAWLAVHGRWPSGEIDHINGNAADNRICNLRDVERKENCRNVSLQSSSKSGVTGVNWHSVTNKWRARFKVDGKEHYLGLFDSIEKAAEIVEKARIEFGFRDSHGQKNDAYYDAGMLKLPEGD